MIRQNVFGWNGFYCLCCYEVFTTEVKEMFCQSIQLLGKDFAVIKDEVPHNGKICSYRLIIKETENEFLLRKKEKDVILYVDKRNLLETEMVSCLLLHIFLMEGMKYNILPFHASLVCLKGKNILLLGESGAGKTTLAFELCINEGAKMIANDFVALKWKDEKLEIMWDDRNSKMSLRKNVQSVYSEQNHLIEDKYLGSENRNYYNPKQMNIQLYEGKGFIDEIVWIEVSEFGENMQRKLEYEQNMQKFYLNCMGLITGIQLKLYDFNGNCQSSCLNLLETNRLKDVYDYIEMIIRQYGCRELKGDLNYIKSNL